MLPLCFSVGGASAKVSTMKSSFFLGSSAASYNEETGKFEWSTTWNNMMDLFRNLQGQVSKYKHLKIKLSEATHGYRLLFYKGNDNVIIFKDATDLTVDLDLTKLELKEGWTIDDIDRICIAGAADGTGSFTIMPADVTLETDDIETLTVTPRWVQPLILTPHSSGTTVLSLEPKKWRIISVRQEKESMFCGDITIITVRMRAISI